MIKSYVVFVLLFFIHIASFGQLEKDLVSISEQVNKDRYAEIDGSPYYYDEWQSGDIISSDGKHHNHDKINFNGLTGDLEIMDGINVRKLRTGGFLKVIVNINDRTDTFLRGIHPNFNFDLICVSYDGPRLKLLTEFNVRKDKYQDTRTKVEKFARRSSFYLLFDDKLEPVAFRKKKIINILGHGDEIEAYLKESKLSIRSTDELVTLLAYFEANIL